MSKLRGAPGLVGRCNCSQGQECPLGKTGSAYRCTAGELRNAFLAVQDGNRTRAAEREKLLAQIPECNFRALRNQAAAYALPMAFAHRTQSETYLGASEYSEIAAEAVDLADALIEILRADGPQ
jgi:hypothetical protein